MRMHATSLIRPPVTAALFKAPNCRQVTAGIFRRQTHGNTHLSVPQTLYRRPCSSPDGKSGSATGVPQSLHDWMIARLIRTPTLPTFGDAGQWYRRQIPRSGRFARVCRLRCSCIRKHLLSQASHAGNRAPIKRGRQLEQEVVALPLRLRRNDRNHGVLMVLAVACTGGPQPMSA